MRRMKFDMQTWAKHGFAAKVMPDSKAPLSAPIILIAAIHGFNRSRMRLRVNGTPPRPLNTAGRAPRSMPKSEANSTCARALPSRTSINDFHNLTPNWQPRFSKILTISTSWV